MTQAQRLALFYLRRDGVLPLDVAVRLMREGVIVEQFERRFQ